MAPGNLATARRSGRCGWSLSRCGRDFVLGRARGAELCAGFAPTELCRISGRPSARPREVPHLTPPIGWPGRSARARPGALLPAGSSPIARAAPTSLPAGFRRQRDLRPVADSETGRASRSIRTCSQCRVTGRSSSVCASSRTIPGPGPLLRRRFNCATRVAPRLRFDPFPACQLAPLRRFPQPASRCARHERCTDLFPEPRAIPCAGYAGAVLFGARWENILPRPAGRLTGPLLSGAGT